MRGLLVYGSDKALAQFYYLAFQRISSVRHEYRRDNIVCVTCRYDDTVALLQIATDLGISYEILAGENKTATILQIVQEFDPGERITTRFLMEHTGYSLWFVVRAMRKLLADGHVESHSMYRGRYYSRPH